MNPLERVFNTVQFSERAQKMYDLMMQYQTSAMRFSTRPAVTTDKEIQNLINLINDINWMLES